VYTKVGICKPLIVGLQENLRGNRRKNPIDGNGRSCAQLTKEKKEAETIKGMLYRGM